MAASALGTNHSTRIANLLIRVDQYEEIARHQPSIYVTA